MQLKDLSFNAMVTTSLSQFVDEVQHLYLDVVDEKSVSISKSSKWTDEQKSRFIEKLMIGVECPVIYAYYDNNTDYLYILKDTEEFNAILEFVNNRFSLKNVLISDEEMWLHNKLYSDLTPIPKRRFNNTELNIINVDYSQGAMTEEDIRYVAEILR